MVIVRPAFALALVSLFSGCGYVHFGRLPEGNPALGGDARLAEAYATLGTEHKILKQELALARKEGDALRVALDRAGGSSSGSDLTARLSETTRELASLRAAYAKLQSERASSPAASGGGGSAELAALEERLAVSLRNYSQLQEENGRLRTDLSRARSENTGLADQLKTAVARHDQAQAALAQLNTELMAQKEARMRAEQATAAMHTQLGVVMARAGAAGTVTPTGASADGSDAAGSLRLAKAPPADASAELRVNTAQLRPGASGSSVAAPRTHVVQVGDTLEKIAQRYYGTGEKWNRIVAANPALSSGRPLTAGMELVIPE